MSFTILIKDFFSSLWRAIELTTIQIEKFNIEQKSIEPFKDVRRKAEQIKHIVRLASLIIPESYIKTHELINCTSDITDIFINLMNTTINNPKQRREVLKLLNTYSQHVKNNNSDFIKMKKSFASLEMEFHEHGLDSNASISDKIKLILQNEPEENAMEKAAIELLPKVNEILKETRETMTKLQIKIDNNFQEFK